MFKFGKDTPPSTVIFHAETKFAETKGLPNNDSTIDTNYDPDIFDASGPVKGEPNYRYFSDPKSGLTAFFDASKYKAKVIDIKNDLGITISDKFKVLALHLQPVDEPNAPAIVDILMHNKSGNTPEDQKARDGELDKLKEIGEAVHTKYQVNKIRYQGDMNISTFIPKDPKKSNLAYLKNNDNYTVNEAGLNNFFNHLTPNGALLSRYAPSQATRIKGRAENILDNQQANKLGTLEGGSKGVCVEMTFPQFPIYKATSAAQQAAVIKSIGLPTKQIDQFGVEVFDCDHTATENQFDNHGDNFVTAALINAFGPQGFQKESELILASKNTYQDRIQREQLKNQFTEEVFGIILTEINKFNIDMTPVSNAPTLSDSAKFILKHEWVFMNSHSLNRLLVEIKNLASTKALNTHCVPARRILGTDEKIRECIKSILNKNYNLTLVDNDKALDDPVKDEMINIKINNTNLASYKLRNHEGRCFGGSVKCAIPENGKLSPDEKEALKVLIIQDVNAKNPAKPSTKPAAVKGSQFLNSSSENWDWQLCAGFPSNKSNWNPLDDQMEAVAKLGGAAVIAVTEFSSQKHHDINAKSELEKKSAAQRDKENYTELFKGKVDDLCHRLNAEAKRKLGRAASAPNATVAPQQPQKFAFKPTSFASANR